MSSEFLFPGPLLLFTPTFFVQDLKIDLAGLQERLRAAEGLQGELEASRETYGGLREEIEAIDARTKELSETLAELHAVADQVPRVLQVHCVAWYDSFACYCCGAGALN